MPGMTGVQLAAELRASMPSLLVILLSGNAATEDLMVQAGGATGPVVLLAKPCPPRELLRVIADVLRTNPPQLPSFGMQKQPNA